MVEQFSDSQAVGKDAKPREASPEQKESNHRTVYMKLTRLAPDIQQYKPYSPALEPSADLPIYVAIRVSTSNILRWSKFHTLDCLPPNAIIISSDGLWQLALTLTLAQRKQLGA